MHTLDLDSLNGPPRERRLIATSLDGVFSRGLALSLDNHGLDIDLLLLLERHGRDFVQLPALRESVADHRRGMMGVAQRVLRVVGLALHSDPNHFVDRYSGDPRADLVLVADTRAAQRRARTQGLIGLRQEAGGRVTAWAGPQLVALSGGRYGMQRAEPHATPGVSAVLDFATPFTVRPGVARHRAPGHIDMNSRQFSRRPAAGSVSFHEHARSHAPAAGVSHRPH